VEKSIIRLPTLRQLGHLVALADARHFGRAAAASHVTQSTLSASIKELEDVLQASLVDRTKRRVVLTPLGTEVAERARRLLEDADEIARLAQREAAPLTGTLRMGVIPTIGPFLLPAVLPRLRRA
jgi:LysR family hydrogen peroxide-inducible transcriptional activator